MITIRNNPFSSCYYEQKFSSHFLGNTTPIEIDFIRGIKFYKHPRFPLLVNIGRNLTKGVHYQLKVDYSLKNKKNLVCLIMDLPQYFRIDNAYLPDNIGLRRAIQYPGYYINLQKFQDLNDYLLSNFGKNTRYRLRKFKNRLENCFDIKYKMHHGNISEQEYQKVFTIFRALLEKRFEEKQIRNNNLDPDEWKFYRDIAYDMILNKEACLFVIYEQDNPISVTLNYLGDDILYNAITVFDTDYGKFHVGMLAILKQLEWSYENNIKVFDFSKGHYDYKAAWSTNKYNFEYHIYYSKNSITSSCISKGYLLFLHIIQFLRDKRVNDLYNIVLHKLSSGEKKSLQEFELEKISEIPSNLSLIEVDRNDPEHFKIKKPLYEFLYLSKRNIRDIRLIYDPVQHRYYIIGENLSYIINFLNQ